MECPICLDRYTKDMPPYMLNCGHPFCLKWLGRLVDNSHVKCPICKQTHFVSSVDRIKEFVVVNLSIITKAEMEESKQMPDSRYSISQDQRNGLNVELPYGFKWSKHRKLVHSYVNSNNTLMWSGCINESTYSVDKIKPIPQIVKQFTSDLYSAKVKKQQCLIQMRMWKKDLEIHFEK